MAWKRGNRRGYSSAEAQRLREEKLRLELKQVKEQLAFQQAQTIYTNLQIQTLSKPWWRREPIQTLTLAFAILSGIIGFRTPSSERPEVRPQQTEIVEQVRPQSDPYLESPPQIYERQLRGFQKLQHETEQQRFRRLLLGVSVETRREIQDVLRESKTVLGEGFDADVVRRYIQGQLETSYRFDPLWQKRTLTPPDSQA
jgi:hypothetical protein